MENKQINRIKSVIELIKNINKMLAYSQGYLSAILMYMTNDILLNELDLGDFEQCENM